MSHQSRRSIAQKASCIQDFAKGTQGLPSIGQHRLLHHPLASSSLPARRLMPASQRSRLPVAYAAPSSLASPPLPCSAARAAALLMGSRQCAARGLPAAAAVGEVGALSPAASKLRSSVAVPGEALLLRLAPSDSRGGEAEVGRMGGPLCARCPSRTLLCRPRAAACRASSTCATAELAASAAAAAAAWPARRPNAGARCSRLQAKAQAHSNDSQLPQTMALHVVATQPCSLQPTVSTTPTNLNLKGSSCCSFSWWCSGRLFRPRLCTLQVGSKLRTLSHVRSWPRGRQPAYIM